MIYEKKLYFAFVPI